MKNSIFGWEMVLITLGLIATVVAETSRATGWTPF